MSHIVDLLELDQHPVNAGLLTVDPGLGGTGLAFWKDFTVWESEGVRPPDSVHSLRTGRQDSHWWDRCIRLSKSFELIMRRYRWPGLVVVEGQELWSSSGTSQASVGKGDMFKTAYLVGMIGHTVHGGRCICRLVPPSQWKGQLSKQAVVKRIKRRLPDVEDACLADHVSDAVGLGLFLMGGL